MRIVLNDPLPHQRPIWESPARKKLLVCGRQYGKTELGIISAVYEHGKGKFRGAARGALVWWVAPNYPQAMMVWRRLKDACAEGWKDKSEAEHTIYFHGGGIIRVRSADQPDSLRGEAVQGLIIDEAAFIDEYAWASVLRPTTAANQAWVMMLTTPNGKNWIYRQWLSTPKNARWGGKTEDNPLIPREEIEDARANLPASIFAQEWLGHFVTPRGSVFQEEWFQYYRRLPEGEPRRIIHSWDTAHKTKQENDYSVGIIAHEYEDAIYIVDLIRGKWDFYDLKQEIFKAHRDHRANAVIIEDAASGQSLIQELKRPTPGQEYVPVYPYRGGGKDKYARASAAVPILRQGFVKLPAAGWVPDFIREMTNFPPPRGEHDDQVDAFSQLTTFLDFRSRPRQKRTASGNPLTGQPYYPSLEKTEEKNNPMYGFRHKDIDINPFAVKH